MGSVIEWLLNSDPWTEYRTRIDLLREPLDSEDVIKAKIKIIENERIRTILKELEEWPAAVLNSHKSASQPIHKLSFIADIGLTIEDANIKEVVNKILFFKSEEGIYQVKMNISKQFGGSGEDQFAWALCDAPIIMYFLLKSGVDYESKLKDGTDYLINLARNNGWPCAVSKELGKFRGPGRKEDPCPYANLIMVKLLLQINEYKNSEECKKGIDSILNNWERSSEIHPYMFYMGTDFRKLKAPFIWYDILHISDTLSQSEYARKDKRFMEMVDLIKTKADIEGRYIPESIWLPWKEWDFGQKKKPSAWLTLLVMRILKRMGAI